MQALQQALRGIAASEMRQDTGHDLAHLDRVWCNCQRIMENEAGATPAWLLAAAYLHDLVNLSKSDLHRDQASRRSAKAAQPHLTALGFDTVAQEAITHAIEAHSFSAAISPTTIEAKILRDADRLDAIGAIGIARTFMISGQMQTPLYDAADPFAHNRPLDDRAYALDHWEQKLLGLADTLCTQSAKTIAAERVAFMRLYLAQLGKEIDH